MDPYKHWYLGKTVAEDKDAWRKAWEKNELPQDTFFLILGTRPQWQLELMSVSEYNREKKRGIALEIAGIAADKEEAFELVCSILQEAMDRQGITDIKEYLNRYKDRKKVRRET